MKTIIILLLIKLLLVLPSLFAEKFCRPIMEHMRFNHSQLANNIDDINN